MAGEPHGDNLPAYQLDAATVATRNGEFPGTPFTDGDGDGSISDPYLGCNRAGSNAPGIGVNTGNIDPKLDDWSVLDQDGAARVPQNSQHIGGDALGDGGDTVNPLESIIDPNGAPIFGDTLSFIEALAQAAPGVGFGAANGNPINRTAVTIEVGDRAWGTNT